MMYETPFDEAIYPLMANGKEEDDGGNASSLSSPAVVKLERWSTTWTELTQLSSGSSLAFTNNDDDDDDEQKPLFVHHDKGGLLDDIDIEETIVFQEDALLNMEQVVLQERHKDIVDIHHDMKQINAISKDLAELVETQEGDVKRMSWLAIEAFEHSESGLEQLVQANNNKFGNKSGVWSTKHYVVWMAALAIVAAWALWQQSVDGSGEWAETGTGGTGTGSTSSIRAEYEPVIHLHDDHPKAFP